MMSRLKVYNSGTINCVLKNNKLPKNISIFANTVTEHVTLHETKGIQLKLSSEQTLKKLHSFLFSFEKLKRTFTKWRSF